MRSGVDSLSITVAAGILLAQLRGAETERCGWSLSGGVWRHRTRRGLIEMGVVVGGLAVVLVASLGLRGLRAAASLGTRQGVRRALR